MNKILVILIALILIATGCSEVQQEPFCNAPYIEYKTGECCLDKDMNDVCDDDEASEDATENEVKIAQSYDIEPSPAVRPEPKIISNLPGNLESIQIISISAPQKYQQFSKGIFFDLTPIVDGKATTIDQFCYFNAEYECQADIALREPEGNKKVLIEDTALEAMKKNGKTYLVLVDKPGTMRDPFDVFLNTEGYNDLTLSLGRQEIFHKKIFRMNFSEFEKE